MTWLQQLVQRRLIAVSGLIAFVVGNSILQTAVSVSSKPYWRVAIDSDAARIAFWMLLLYAIVWIASSLLALRALSKKQELCEHIVSYPLMQQPVLVQIMTFVTVWILAATYVFLAADVSGGIVLSGLGIIHVFSALLVAPLIIRKSNGT